MKGAIAGDVAGSVWEGTPEPPAAYPLVAPNARFTDDTVLSVAVAEAMMSGEPYATSLRRWGRRYPDARYGRWFRSWLGRDGAGPYNSYGNGSAMRVAAIGWLAASLEEVIDEATRSATATHTHPEGIKGAQAVAAAVYAARTGASRQEIAELLSARFAYTVVNTEQAFAGQGPVGLSCQETVPAAASCFLIAEDVESTVRRAIALGGDTDTCACIAGAIAEAFYGSVPAAWWNAVESRLDAAILGVLRTFSDRVGGLPPRTPVRQTGARRSDA